MVALGRGRGSRLFPVLLLLWGGLSCGYLSTPGRPFERYQPPPAPDYADESSWAALPWKKSRADAVPRDSDLRDEQAEAIADAFYVHPTSYFWRSHWNAPTDGALTNRITGAMLAGQASALNGSARIFAPRYRQMTLAGFAYPHDRERALALAYSDVRRAFLHYLSTWSDGRPIFLVGHSQGSRMLDRLLREFFDDGPLRERLVVAYIPGARIWRGLYEREELTVPICQHPDQTGCFVTWRTFAEGADPSLDTNPQELPDGPSLCVNPLSWRHDDEPVPAEDNLGSIGLPMLRGPGPVRPHATGARCGEGVLWVQPVSGWGYGSNHADGNWHAYDFALFYVNIRENAARRLAAHLGQQPGP